MPSLPSHNPDDTPAGLSTFATIGLLILAIGGLAAISAWLWAWYRGREALATEGADAPVPDDPTAGPDDPTAPTPSA